MLEAFRVGLVIALVATPPLAQETLIRGRVLDAPAETPVRVFAVPCQVTRDGVVHEPSKPAIFRAASTAPHELAEEGRFEIEVEPGAHAVFAYADGNGDGDWDPGVPEPLGWFQAGPAQRFDAVRLEAGAQAVIDVALKVPHPFPREERIVEGSALRWIRGYPVLQLRGDARRRGYAHGKLIPEQILDVFRFYLLEDRLRSATAYESEFRPFLQSHFALPEDYRIECEAVVEGMRDSGVDLYVPELDREFDVTDLQAISGYIETRSMRASCTQFAAWGERTRASEVRGGMLTGRNMDGECDLRKVTVSHFLLFAVEPSEEGRKRYVSMMWPGFVGTISGINEDGFHAMENAGGTGPGPVVDELVPLTWITREALARLDGRAGPDDVDALYRSFANAAGGSCGPGGILLFATPFVGQRDPAFVLEGDRFGHALRRVAETAPFVDDAILASNHFFVYGGDPDHPNTFFGREPSFSSLWRYEAGRHRLESWVRAGRAIGTREMRDLLQTVAHGTTEYAIITRPNLREIDVAVASLEAEPWDAPYRAWTTFHFDDLFASPAPDKR